MQASDWIQTSVARSCPNIHSWNVPRAALVFRHIDLMLSLHIPRGTSCSQLPRINSPPPGVIPPETRGSLHCPGALAALGSDTELGSCICLHIRSHKHLLMLFHVVSLPIVIGIVSCNVRCSWSLPIAFWKPNQMLSLSCWLTCCW